MLKSLCSDSNQDTAISSMRGLLLRSSGLAIFQNIVRVGTAVVSVPLSIGYLGNERYGLWMITLTTLSFVSFFDAGLSPVLKNRMADAYGKKDNEQFKQYSTTSILICLFILISGLGLSLVLPLIDWSRIFNVTDNHTKLEVLPLVYVIFAVAVARLAFSQVESIYAAQLRLQFLKVLEIGCTACGFLLLLSGIYFRVSLPFLALFVSLPYILSGVLLTALVFIWNRDFFLPNVSISRRLIMNLFGSSIPFIGIKVCEVFIAALPNLLIAYFLNLSVVTTYSVSYSLASVPLFIVTAVLPVYWPAFTVAWSKGEKQWLYNTLNKLSRASLALILLYACVLGVIGPWIVSVWTQGKVNVSGGLLLLIGLYIAIQAYFYWLSTFLHSISDFTYELLCHVSWALLFCTISLFLVPRYNLYGMLSAMLISLICACALPMKRRTNLHLLLRVTRQGHDS